MSECVSILTIKNVLISSSGSYRLLRKLYTSYTLSCNVLFYQNAVTLKKVQRIITLKKIAACKAGRL